MVRDQEDEEGEENHGTNILLTISSRLFSQSEPDQVLQGPSILYSHGQPEFQSLPKVSVQPTQNEIPHHNHTQIALDSMSLSAPSCKQPLDLTPPLDPTSSCKPPSVTPVTFSPVDAHVMRERTISEFEPMVTPSSSIEQMPTAQTLFGVLEETAREVLKKDEIITLRFLDSCEVYGRILEVLGMNTARNDLVARTSAIQIVYEADPAHRSTLRQLLFANVDVENLNWLVWGMEFFLFFFLFVFSGVESPGRMAYEETLLKHHSRGQKIRFSAYLLMLPTKEYICNCDRLLLAGTGDSDRTEVLEREIPQGTELMLDILAIADICAETYIQGTEALQTKPGILNEAVNWLDGYASALANKFV